VNARFFATSANPNPFMYTTCVSRTTTIPAPGERSIAMSAFITLSSFCVIWDCELAGFEMMKLSITKESASVRIFRDCIECSGGVIPSYDAGQSSVSHPPTTIVLHHGWPSTGTGASPIAWPLPSPIDTAFVSPVNVGQWRDRRL